VPEPALAAERVARSYGTGRTEVRAVRDVDLALDAGERVLVMGPSGSGKTTLLSMLGGLLSPDSGRVLVGGTDIYAIDEAARARVRREQLGFVFQSFNLMSALTAQENVEVPLRLAGRGREAASRSRELLGRLGLAERARHRPRDLSGGEKQRVAIARALANEPRVVLADEPTANLDSETGHEVAEILCQLGRDDGRAVVIVSHDQRLRDIASRVLWLEDGRLTRARGAGTTEGEPHQRRAPDER
jgi:putative ABC transport system ATP-binding protein